jgi:hypothetical protein
MGINRRDAIVVTYVGPTDLQGAYWQVCINGMLRWREAYDYALDERSNARNAIAEFFRAEPDQAMPVCEAMLPDGSYAYVPAANKVTF